ncbi:hypothetical protein [Marinicellulosiphila megalodicopiae]|uniref:hypothetical protein n=1 Tax=Marinicellulosiphila megalodicopiae TaxID=2724896 RepID=UPI003BAE6C52
MNKSLLKTTLKTTLGLTLTVAVLSSAMIAHAKFDRLDDLNLTETQIEQLKEYRETKKEMRQAQKESQIAEDKAALEAFLTPEQADAILNKMDKHHGKNNGKHKKNGKGNNILKMANQLELTENQVAQIKAIYQAKKVEKIESSEKPSKEEMKAKHTEIHSQIEAVLTSEQVEKLKAMQQSHQSNKERKIQSQGE